MSCEADCKIRKRKFIKMMVEVTPGAANPKPPEDKYPAPKDYKVALQAKIDKWMEDKTLAPKCASGCVCEATENVDWDKKLTLTRTFHMSFKANGFDWEVEATVDFKSAIVPGDCVEDPAKPIELASAAIIPELGITLLSEKQDGITLGDVEKVRKALS